MKWILVIACIGSPFDCFDIHNQPPNVQREFATRDQCDRALLRLDRQWPIRQGAWTMNCRREPR